MMRPPERKMELFMWLEPPPMRKEPPRKLEPPVMLFAIVKPLAAIKSSAIMEPPVCPTLTPRLFIKLSIFWLIFRKAIAHRNQMKIFPAAASLPTASTSASVTANTVTDWEKNSINAGMVYINFFFKLEPPYNDKGLERKVPTIEVNSLRHHAFIRSRKSWPPNILHHDLKMFEVDWEAPIANATGAVYTITPGRM